MLAYWDISIIFLQFSNFQCDNCNQLIMRLLPNMNNAINCLQFYEIIEKLADYASDSQIPLTTGFDDILEIFIS